MSEFYAKNGKKIDIATWSKLLRSSEYKIIKQEDLPNNRWISTVWIGIDHSFGEGRPLIFETMVFDKVKPRKVLGITIDKEECDMDRYSTLKQAEKGHELMVKKYS